MFRLARPSFSPLSLAFTALVCGSIAAQTVGDAFQVSSAIACENPVAAYDETVGTWLVVYAIATGATTAELRGQVVRPDGLLQGFPFVIEANADRSVPPTLCNMNQGSRFVVGYRRNFTGPFPTLPDFNWYVRSIVASVPSNRVLVPYDAATTGTPTEMVLGGDVDDSLFAAERALLVVRRSAPPGGSNSIAFASVDTSGADPVVGAFTTLATVSTLCGDVAVSPHAGTGIARWLVSWCQSTGAVLPFTTVRAHFVDISVAACGPLMQIASGLTAVEHPSVAIRSGERFAVAWELGSDIRVRPIDYTGTCATGAVTMGTTIAPVSSGANSLPSIAWAKNKYALTWRNSSLGVPTAVFTKGLDPNSCAACSQEWPLEFGTDAQSEPVVASCIDGGNWASDAALVVWSEAVGNIRARRYEATSTDVVTNLGGGCAGAGLQNVATNDGECVIGNSAFKLVLANPTVPALALIVGFSPLAAPCGSCTIVPSLDILLPGVSPTTLPIPCDPLLIGGNLYAQWMVLKASSCPLLPDFAFSNALRFSIGE